MTNLIPVKDFSGYFINILGEVYSSRTSSPNAKNSTKLRLLKQTTNKMGYKVIGFARDDNQRTKMVSIHRLIALHFIPNDIGPLAVVDHINRNKLDNRIENLRWVTRSDNARNCDKYDNAKTRKKECVEIICDDSSTHFDLSEWSNSDAGIEYVFSKITSRTNEPLKQKTISTYIQRIKTINKLITGTEYNGNIEWINDADNVISKLGLSAFLSKKDYVTPLIHILTTQTNNVNTISKYRVASSKI